MNVSGIPDGGLMDTGAIVFVIGLNVLTSVVGSLTNTVMAVTIIKSKVLRTAMNITITNLALSDTIICLINIPIRIALYSGIHTSELCYADVFFHSLSDCIKPSMLAATSYERYQSIAKPFESRGKLKRTIVTVCLSWIIAIGVGIASVLTTIDGATLYPCSMTSIMSVNTVINFRELLVTLPVGVVSLLLVVLFYYLMMKTLNEHSKTMTRKPNHFKNKVSPKESIKRPSKFQEPKLTAASSGMKKPDNPDCLDKNWRNEQYTDSHKHDGNLSPVNAKSMKTNKVTAGPSQDNSHAEDLYSKNENSSVANITEAVSRVHVSKTKRFSVRETRKSIIRIMKAQNLIGKNTAFGLPVSLPDKNHDRLAEENILDANSSERRLSCDLKNPNFDEMPKVDSVKINKVTTDLTPTSTDTDNLLQVPTLYKGIRSEMKRGAVQDPVMNIDDKTPAINSTYDLEKHKTSQPSKYTSITGKVEDTDDKTKTDLLNDSCLPVNSLNSVPMLGSPTKTIHSTVTNENDSEIHSKVKPGSSVDNAQCIPSSKTSAIEHDTTSQRIVNKNTTVEKEHEANTKDVSVTLVKTEPHTSHKIDVVEMDGTVHKRVEVQGSVTGAVCVLNTSNKVQGRRKVEMRAAKRIAVLIGSFVVLWLPLPLSVIYVVSQGYVTASGAQILMVVGTISATTTAVNPVLNLMVNKQIRSAARNNLKRGFLFIKR